MFHHHYRQLTATGRVAMGALLFVVVSAMSNAIVRRSRATIEFSDFPVMREVVDARANVLPTSFALDHKTVRNR